MNRNFSLGCNLAFARSTGEFAVFLNNDTEVQPGWLAPLRRALDDPEVLGVQSLLLYPNGAVQCAGMVFPARGTFPVPFLAHHPAEDALRIGRSFALSAVAAAALAMRSADVAALGGFDAIFRNGWEDVDLCLRLQRLRPGRFEVRTDSVVVHHEGRTPGRHGHTPANRRLFHERWLRRVPPGDEHLWQAAGFEVVHYREDAATRTTKMEVGRPVLARRPGRVAEGPAAGLPAFRWALKIAAPAGPAGLAWGDLHFARSLGRALEQLGQTVVIDRRRSHRRDSTYLDDIVLVLRGLVPVAPIAGGLNLLWVISHPDAVGVEEIAHYDAVYSAGAPWAARMSGQVDVPVETLLQCTDPERFHPGVASPDSGEPVVFVGNSRSVFRSVVRNTVAAGLPVAVYGNGWEQFLDERFIRAAYLPHEEVAATYRSAGVLLNDHWDDMRREGFLSNRLFDAAAAGARVLSDDVPGLKEIFGGLVRTYNGVDELAEILGSPGEAFPSEADRLLLAEHVRREHSFDVRARTLLDTAARLWRA